MIWLLLPAGLSLVIKLSILWFSRKTLSLGKPSIFVGLIVISAMHNLCEIITFSLFLSGGNPEYLFRTYYVLSCGMLGYILAYAIQVTQIDLKNINRFLATLCILVGVAILSTDLVISGYTAIDYSITAIKGPHYWLFQIPLLTMLLLTVTVLITGYIRSEDNNIQISSLYTLAALLPLVIVGIGVVVLMQMGFKINAMVAVPISTTLFILITLRNESTHRLTDIRRMLPMSPEHKTCHKIMDSINDYTTQTISYKEAIKEIEISLLNYSTEKTSDNITRTAKMMKMPRSTVYATQRRLGINSRAIKENKNAKDDK
ncbi:MAG: hypothetical protein ACRBHB_07100 [Arenicella sp.]